MKRNDMTKIIARVPLKTIVDDMNSRDKTSITCKSVRVTLRKHRIAKFDDNYMFLENEIARIRHLANPRKYPAPNAPAKTRRARKTPAPAPVASDA
jgi:hypothetical protein